MYRLIVLAILFLTSSAAFAATMCTDVFPDGLSTHGGANRIDFGFNARLINSPDNILDARRIDVNGGSTIPTCNSTNCQQSNNSSPELDPGSFQTTNVNQDVNIGFQQSLTIGSGTFSNNEFDRVTTGSEATLTFSDNHNEYFIDELTLGFSSVLNLQGGATYWIRSLSVGSSVQVNVQGSGTAVVYVNNNFTIGSASLFNADNLSSPRDSTRLAVYGFNNVTLSSPSTFSGYLYAQNRVNLGSSAAIFGAVSARRIDLNSDATVTFNQTTNGQLSLGTFCDSLIANYEYEEANPTEDIANDNNGSFVGGATDLRLAGATNSQTCSVLDVPLNLSIGNNDAFETEVNVRDQLGDQGTISFWYRSDTPWFQGFFGRDRTLFEASIPFGNNNDNEDKFFFLVLQNNGQLLFGLEDDNDNNAILVSQQFNFPADEWVHIAATWDVDARDMGLFINGNEVVTGFIELAINSVLSETNTLHLGDNRSSYVPAVGTSPNSGNGQFDSLRLYNFVQTEQEVDADRAATDVTSCGSPVETLAFYQFQPTEVTTDSEGFQDGALVGGATGVQLPVSVNTCGVLDVPLNQSITNNDAFDTRVNIANQIGNQGTISFWYRSDLDWNLGGSGIDRQLFDASIPFGNNNDNQDRFFFLVLQPNGRVLFGLEDTFDRNGLLETSAQNFSADEWVHIAATWNTNTAEMTIFINGIQAPATFIEQNAFGQLSETTSLYIGDNRSTYLPGVGTSQNSSNGQYDEVRLYRFDQTSEQVLADINAQPLGCFDDVLINHYRLNFDPSFTCSIAEVEVQACANENCDLLATANSNLVLTTTNGTFSNTNLTFVGSTTSNLSLSTAGTAVIDGVNASPDAPVRCFNSGVEDASCTVSFSDVGLNVSYGSSSSIVDIPNGSSQVAFDTPIFVSVDQAGACDAELNGRDLEIAVQCNNPGSCNTRQLEIGGTRINNIEAFSPVTGVTFDANGLATIPAGLIQYRDAGQIQLRFRDAQNETMGNSNSFVMRPILVAVNQLNSPSVAGTTSLLEYEAVGVEGSLTPNYDPSDLEVRVVKVLPQTGFGVQGILELNGQAFTSGNASNPGNPNDPERAIFQDIEKAGFNFLGNGGFSNNIQPIYSEVGTIELELRDADYLDSGEIIAAAPTSEGIFVGPIILGPYRPAYLDVGVQGTVPTMPSTCSVSNTPYSYIGENIPLSNDLQFIVTAMNARNQITQNYGGDNPENEEDVNDLWRLNIRSIEDINRLSQDDRNELIEQLMLRGAETDSLRVASNISIDGVINGIFSDNGTEADYDGTAIYTLSTPIANFIKEDTPQLPESFAEFNISFLSISDDNESTSFIADSDNVCYREDASGECIEFPDIVINGGFETDPLTGELIPIDNRLLYGRLVIGNAFGSENEPLLAPFATEFFTAAGVFAQNTNDNCTATNFVNTEFGRAAPPDGFDVSDQIGDIFSTGTLFNGINLTFEGINIPAPGSLDSTGQFILLLNQETGVTGQPWQDFLNFDWDGDGDIDENDNPSAQISFGFFRGNDRIIHWREVFN